MKNLILLSVIAFSVFSCQEEKPSHTYQIKTETGAEILVVDSGDYKIGGFYMYGLNHQTDEVLMGTVTKVVK